MDGQTHVLMESLCRDEKLLKFDTVGYAYRIDNFRMLGERLG